MATRATEGRDGVTRRARCPMQGGRHNMPAVHSGAVRSAGEALASLPACVAGRIQLSVECSNKVLSKANGSLQTRDEFGADGDAHGVGGPLERGKE